MAGERAITARQRSQKAASSAIDDWSWRLFVAASVSRRHALVRFGLALGLGLGSGLASGVGFGFG